MYNFLGKITKRGLLSPIHDILFDLFTIELEKKGIIITYD
jgi:hypothetical protein